MFAVFDVVFTLVFTCVSFCVYACYTRGGAWRRVGTRGGAWGLAKYKSACLCTIQHPINELVSVLELFVKVSDTTLH